MASNDKPAILKLRKAMLLYVLGSIILLLGVFVSYGYHNQIKSNISSASPILPVLMLSLGALIVLLGAWNVYTAFTMMGHIDKIYNFGRYGDMI